MSGRSNKKNDREEHPDAESDENAQSILKEYIENSSAPPERWQRIKCCGSSRYLHCTECYRILIPREDWPHPLREKSMQLPFRVDMLLDDRRKCSTGVQVMSILKALDGTSSDDKQEEQLRNEPTNNLAELYDVERDEIPNYRDNSEDGTYLLFPGENSEPLSSVVQHSKIKRLVLIDCTWTSSSLRLHPSVQALPKVHLDKVPEESLYWRWHNAGAGMLSTVEALYFAAWQTADSLGWSYEERKQLIHLLWLFSLQRSVIHKKYVTKQIVGINPHLPWTEDAKEFARELRRNGRE